MKFKFSNLWFLVGSLLTILMNFLAVYLPINNINTAAVSDKFFTILTPAGFIFTIWGVIYTGLVVIGLLILTNNYKLSFKGLIYFLLSCVANSLWILSWHNFHLLICAVILLLLVFFNYKVYQELEADEEAGPKKYLVTNWYLIYLGWTIVAAIINVTSLLQYNFGLENLSLIINVIFGLVILYIGFLINLLFDIKKRNIMTLLVFLWALIGIQNGQKNIVLASDLFRNGIYSLYVLIIASIVAILLFRNRKLDKHD